MLTRKLLQINSVSNFGSTGKIVEDIGKLVQTHGWESWIACGRGNASKTSHNIQIGKKTNIILHGIQSRLFDRHGLGSSNPTTRLLTDINTIYPDIIHLHNIHGYYLNYRILFNFLHDWKRPVVWTLHDCWPFTGHCAYYSSINCNKWQEQCHNCKLRREYPASLFIDHSSINYTLKKHLFNSIENLTLVCVSDWLSKETKKSFLNSHRTVTIKNGINQDIFCPQKISFHTFTKYNIDLNKRIIIGVANKWDERKGLTDFINLSKIIGDKYQIVLVGLSNKQINNLPKGIIGIQRTENINDLVNLYSIASVYVNCSIGETLGLTTLEAQACGTPAIVYDSTACPETVSEKTGIIVRPHDIHAIKTAIEVILESTTSYTTENCVEFISHKFNYTTQLSQYMALYESLI